MIRKCVFLGVHTQREGGFKHVRSQKCDTRSVCVSVWAVLSRGMYGATLSN